jgi:ATP-binding cassette subfamily B protein
MRILKYCRQASWTALVIMVLLVGQGFCELLLPRYTSSIVDIGIAQGGIADAVPQQIRPESLDKLGGFMTAGEKAQIYAAYQQNEAGIYILTALPAEQRQVLDAILAPAMLAAERAELESAEGINPGTVAPPPEAGAADLSTADPAEITRAAVRFITEEYAAAGLDRQAVQFDYMRTVGTRMALLTLGSVVAAVFASLLASYSAAKVSKNLRARVYARILSFSNVEMDHFSSASLITRNTNDIQQIQMTVFIILRMVLYAPILGIGGIIMVAGTRTGMGWIVAVAVALALILVLGLMGITMPKFKQMQRLIDHLNLVSREILTGLPVIRAFGREQHEEQRFDQASRQLMQTQLFTQRAMSLMMPAMMLVMNAVTVLIVWMGVDGANMGRLQVGDMMAFITYTMQIVMSFMMFSMVSIMLPRANVAAERVEEVLNAVPVITDPVNPLAEERTNWAGRVKFTEVFFRFPDAQQDVLRGVSFEALPGRTTAIIGSTGSGKSTLINLIPRLYDVTGGSISIDGVDIRAMRQHTLRALLGFVPQKGVLFSGDVASNLKFGNPDIADADMEAAARIAQAETFIREREGGYHSPIAQGGSNVSGGQKQRLSIARAIAKKPKIFIFDDSFSALDYKTDAALRRALRENVRDATVIIVAQRISTVLYADQIVVLDEGRLAGIGTHTELLQTCEAYREIARSQLGEEELAL